MIARLFLGLFVLILSLGCSIERELSKGSNDVVSLTIATIDSATIEEIQFFVDDELPSIYDYYQLEKDDDYTTWSERLFGRCCSNADLSFNENLYLKVKPMNSGIEIRPISDSRYLTSFSFNPEDRVEISIALNLEHSYMKGEYSNEKLLFSEDTIMHPIRLSLINGNVQSAAAFQTNGRVELLDFYINGKFLTTIQLLDTPLVQRFEVGGLFRVSDEIKLVPKTYFAGDSNQICISEIQTNLGCSAVQRLNDRFNFSKMMNPE
ncbi:MAG: hypothetical protein AB8B56_17830 [Crocinitomicaceae bacterium]